MKYKASEIEKICFNGVEKGYDPMEVDLLLDEIIADYGEIDQLSEQLSIAQATIASKDEALNLLHDAMDHLTSECEAKNDRIVKLETELTFQKKRLENLPVNKRSANHSLDQLNYIKELETELARLGGDPEKCRSRLYKQTIRLEATPK